MQYSKGKVLNENIIERLKTQGYCFQCALCKCFFKAFISFNEEIGETTNKEGDGSFRIIHESEVFI